MEQYKIFDTYQKKSLLPSLGSSDDIYTKLIEATDDIVEMLKKQPVKIQNYLLVAIDNTISENEPLIDEVENIISARWQMLRSHFKKMPISLYRAIMLEAISKLASQNVKFASAIWFGAIDVYPLLDVPNKEQEVLNEFFVQLGDYVESAAIEDWQIKKENVEVKIPKLDVKLVKSTTIIDEEDMKSEMMAAAGQSAQDGRGLVRPNSYWPNQPQHWAYHFGSRAGEGIARVVNDALKGHTDNLSKNVEALQNGLNGYFTELGKNMKDALMEASKSSIAVERRSQLLWWKETLYSKSEHKSYRQLSEFESAIAMAYDLYHDLPSLFPISVDYILREAFGQIYGLEKKEIKLVDFLNEVSSAGRKSFLTKHFDIEKIEAGRTDIVTYMQKILHEKTDIKKDIVTSLGVKPDTLVSYEEISLWILHSLSAQHLLS